MANKDNKLNKEKKQLRELSEEELKEVTGGSSFDCSLPENKDNVRCSDKFKIMVDEYQFEEQFATLGVNMDPLDF